MGKQFFRVTVPSIIRKQIPHRFFYLGLVRQGASQSLAHFIDRRVGRENQLVFSFKDYRQARVRQANNLLSKTRGSMNEISKSGWMESHVADCVQIP